MASVYPSFYTFNTTMRPYNHCRKGIRKKFYDQKKKAQVKCHAQNIDPRHKMMRKKKFIKISLILVKT